MYEQERPFDCPGSTQGTPSPSGAKIAYRAAERGLWYVANLPGDQGVDWGYSPKVNQALPLSPYWQRRFAADMRRVNAKAQFILA